MSSPVYRVIKLTPRFDLRAFDCGEPAYNDLLVRHAVNAVKAVVTVSSMVYLLLDRVDQGAGERVVGYCAICPTVVVRDDTPKSLQRGVLRAAPAWLLPKHALDRSLRGDKDHRWGARLLRDALERIVASVDLGGGQIIGIDADNPGVIAWYSGQRFQSTGGQDSRPCIYEGRQRAKVSQTKMAGGRKRTLDGVAAGDLATRPTVTRTGTTPGVGAGASTTRYAGSLAGDLDAKASVSKDLSTWVYWERHCPQGWRGPTC